MESKVIALRQKLEILPLRPCSLTEYRVLRLGLPTLRMDVFLREATRERLKRMASVGSTLRREENLRTYVAKTHRLLVLKNIERLKARRSELLYCSKRARPIPMHKQLHVY